MTYVDVMYIQPGTLPTFRFFFFFNDTATTEIYTLSLHDALPIYQGRLNAAELPASTSSDTSVAVSKPRPNSRPTGYMCQDLVTALVTLPRMRFIRPRLLRWCSRASSSNSPCRIRRNTPRMPPRTTRL